MGAPPNPMRAARARLGWTQPQLAAALGLTVATVSRIETGRARLRPIHVLALAGTEKRAQRRWPPGVRYSWLDDGLP